MNNLNWDEAFKELDLIDKRCTGEDSKTVASMTVRMITNTIRITLRSLRGTVEKKDTTNERLQKEVKDYQEMVGRYQKWNNELTRQVDSLEAENFKLRCKVERIKELHERWALAVDPTENTYTYVKELGDLLKEGENEVNR